MGEAVTRVVHLRRLAHAVAPSATVRFPLMDQFWGDRYGQLVDPFGHIWGVCTHKEDVSPEEADRRAEQWMAEAGMKK